MSSLSLLLHKPEIYGRLIARVLPLGMTADYEQTGKPLLRSIDPTSLVAGTGYDAFNPWDSLLLPQRSLRTEYQNGNGMSASSDGNERDESKQITLDIYLFDTRQDRGDSLNSTHIRMNRIANESVSKTLKRMEVSFSKKFKSSANHCKNNKNRGMAAVLVDNSTSSSLLRWSDNTRTSNGDVPSLSSNNILDYLSPLENVTTLTNAQVFGQSEHPLLAIIIQIGKESIPLLVEQNPPSIVGVRTFENFGGHIYAHVPMVVDVDLIYGTRARIDWYTDNVLACQDSPTFIPKDEDVGKHVSVLITPIRQDHHPHDGTGCQEAYRFERPIEKLPENTILSLRPTWTAPRANPDSQQQQQKRSLRVVSYNILADQNAFSGDNQTPFYPYVPASILLRSRRMPLILHEVLSYQADIICLQEVDELVFETLFRPVLAQMGYQGFFSVKQTGGTQEGCATFWSLSKFEKASNDEMRTHLLRELFPKINDAKLQETSWKSRHEIQQLLIRRPDLLDIIETKLGHVMQTVSLHPKRNAFGGEYASFLPESFLVANTHLFYHPHADHIRLMQNFVILHQLDQERQPDGPILYCGDFNTSPTNCAVRLIVERSVPENFNRLQQHLSIFHWGESDQDDSTILVNATTTEARQALLLLDNNNNFPSLELPDHFPTLVSAYGDEPPPFTHYISCFQGCLDHIFASVSSPENRHGLEVLGIAPMPTASDVTRHVAMPSECLPSDHVSLVCDLAWTAFDGMKK